MTYSDLIEIPGQWENILTELPLPEIAKALDSGDQAEAGRLLAVVLEKERKYYEENSYDPSEDERLDDPRHGQAKYINSGQY